MPQCLQQHGSHQVVTPRATVLNGHLTCHNIQANLHAVELHDHHSCGQGMHPHAMRKFHALDVGVLPSTAGTLVY